MNHPLVIGYHLVWTVYGTWLPNDPRGSGSRTVESASLAELGNVHHGRKKIQPPRYEVREFYERAVELLRHPVLTFNDEDRATIGEAFATVIATERYTCYACAVMPDHVHILIRKHKHTVEEIAENLLHASKTRLIQAKRREPGHPIWVGGTPWGDFLDHPDDVRRVIGYIKRNPTKIGLPEQKWPFVLAYNNWPLHKGHSPNSPYARRLRELGRY